MTFLKFLFVGLVFLSPLKAMDSVLEEDPKKTPSVLEKTATLGFEKMKGYLDIIDDDIKREIFFKDAQNVFKSGFFSFDQLKSFLFYVLKLLIVLSLYLLLKRLGLKILDYRMMLLHKRHESIFLKSISTQKNINMIETFAALFNSGYIWVLRIIFSLLFLTTLGINIEPLLYSASFLALAISLSSQSIIKDLINGVFYVVDGSIAVGEYIQTNGHKGLIEHITLRSLQLRYSTGELVSIPFSNISEVINFSRNYAKIKAEVIIYATQDFEPVSQAFDAAFETFKKTHGASIIDTTLNVTFSKVTEFGSHVFAAFKTMPDPTDRMKHYFLALVHSEMIKQNVRRVDGGPSVIVSNSLS